MIGIDDLELLQTIHDMNNGLFIYPHISNGSVLMETNKEVPYRVIKDLRKKNWIVGEIKLVTYPDMIDGDEKRLSVMFMKVKDNDIL